MRFLVTGGCGFLGSNLSAEVMSRGHELFVIDNLYRTGSRDNLTWLKDQGDFKFYEVDTRNQSDIEKIVKDVKPEALFHLAGQVAMTTSIENPRFDFETNVLGGVNVLEAVRQHSPNSSVFYSSTNKVYGDLENIALEEKDTRYITPDFPNGFDEELGLDFRSPYGCSKGSVDQYMLDYHRIFGLQTIVFRHSSIFGGRQFPTIDQGWIGWFIQQALETKENPNRDAFTICGNGKQVRDVLFAEDLLHCYFEAFKNAESCAGEAFNIGGGIDNSLSLLELFYFLEEELALKLHFKELPWRASDQRVFVADVAKAKKAFGWEPAVDKVEGTRQMISWLSEVTKGL